MAGKENDDKQKNYADDPFAFVMDLMVDTVKAFLEGAGFNLGGDKKEKTPMERMEGMMESMMKMFQAQQQMQMAQTQMQMQPQMQQNQQPQAQKQPAQNNIQQPGNNMQMPRMGNMQMGNMQMPQMGNMQMPQMGGIQGMVMSVCMQVMQTMMSGMMQIQQMYQMQMMQQGAQMQQAPQNQQQGPQMQQNPQNQQEEPEKEPEPKGPTEEELRDELIRNTEELQEANREYRRLKAEDDALRAEVEKDVTEADKTIERAQAEMDKNIDDIAKLKAEKDTTIEQEDAELKVQIDETYKSHDKVTATRGVLAFDDFNPDKSQWNEKDTNNAEITSGKLNDKLKAEGAGKDVLDAVGKYNEEIKQFNNKDMAKTVNAEDTMRTYDAAKKFLDVTKPKLIKDGPQKGTYEKLSPEMQSAREGAQNLVNSLDDYKVGQIKERADARAEARKNGKEFTATNNSKEMKWFSKAELDKAINSLDKMRDANGKLGPGAEKFHKSLSELRDTMGKKDGSLNASAYVNAYNAADDFMKESLNSRAGGPEVDAARQAGKDVRKRLNENNRIDKLNVVAQYDMQRAKQIEKTAELNQRRTAQQNRDRQIEKLRTDMRAARAERNAANTDKHNEDKKRLEESKKKLDAAKKRRDEAKKRTYNSQNRRRNQTQKKAPQRNVMGM